MWQVDFDPPTDRSYRQFIEDDRHFYALKCSREGIPGIVRSHLPLSKSPQQKAG